MRIGIYTNSYLPAVHGVVRMISLYKRELNALGHEVYIFCPAEETYIDNDPQVIRYPTVFNYATMDCRIAVPSTRSIDRLISKLHLNIIHSQHPIFIGYEGYRQAVRCGIPLVFTYHTMYDEVLLLCLKRWPRRVLLKIIDYLHIDYLAKCHCIIAPTERIRRVIAARVPQYASKVKVMPAPIDLNAFSQANPRSIREQYRLDGAYTFVNVTRLGLEKNLEVLIQAFALLAGTRSDLRLMLVGDGPARSSLTRLIHELRLGTQVILTGMVPMNDVPDYLAAANAYACASLTETQGLALIEGMAAGLPVVALDAPGSADVIVSEENGLLTQPTTEALAAAMGRLLNESDLCQRLAAQALVTASKYAAPIAAQRLVDLYQQVIDANVSASL